jgi:hypothetical protein
MAVSQGAAAAGIGAAGASMASRVVATKTGYFAGLAGKLFSRSAMGSVLTRGGASRLLVGAAGGMVFALLFGVAMVFFGVRGHWISSTDHLERRELTWFAVAGLLVVLIFTALTGMAILQQSSLLPALSLTGMMVALGAMNLTWLPRILARRHAREALRDPWAAADQRRAERRMAWAGMLLGVVMGVVSLAFGVIHPPLP